MKKDYSTIKTFLIMAGMKFTYPDTTDNNLHIVGHYTVKFTFTHDHALISEKIIKKHFN